VTKNFIRPSVRYLSAIIIPLILVSCAIQEKGASDGFICRDQPLSKIQSARAPESSRGGGSRSVGNGFRKTRISGLRRGGYWHTRQGRDELVYQLIFMCDYRFSRYEADLVAGKATRDTVIDLAVLGLTSAAALTTPGQSARHRPGLDPPRRTAPLG